MGKRRYKRRESPGLYGTVSLSYDVCPTTRRRLQNVLMFLLCTTGERITQRRFVEGSLIEALEKVERTAAFKRFDREQRSRYPQEAA